MNVSVTIEVLSEPSFLSQGSCLGCREDVLPRGGRRCGVSVGGKEAGPWPPGPARASALCSAAGAGSGAAAAAGPESPAPRVQPPGVCARGAQRRASAPPRAHAAARGPGRGQREGPAQGGEGAGPPRAGSSRWQPRRRRQRQLQRQQRARRSQPGLVRPVPARLPAPRRGALSTARGEYRPRRPPQAARRDSPGGVGVVHRHPLALRLFPPLAEQGLRSCRGVLGRTGLPGPRRHKGRGDSSRAPSGKALPGSGPQFPLALWGNYPEVCSPARGTSAWRAGGVDAAGSLAFCSIYGPGGSR